MYRASTLKTTGDVTITAYDTRRGLMSGSYNLKLTDVADPYADLTPTRPARTCGDAPPCSGPDKPRTAPSGPCRDWRTT